MNIYPPISHVGLKFEGMPEQTTIVIEDSPPKTKQDLVLERMSSTEFANKRVTARNARRLFRKLMGTPTWSQLLHRYYQTGPAV